MKNLWIMQPLWYFNSSKVRLKAFYTLWSAPLNNISIPVRCDWRRLDTDQCFFLLSISIPVRCDWRTARLVDCIHRQFDFNSSKVRLKVGRSCLHVSLLLISIPVRCDWRIQQRFGWQSGITISIPVRCDWRPFAQLEISKDSVISIPVRCDWRPPQIPLRHIQRRDFNSSKVRLKAVPWSFRAAE